MSVSSLPSTDRVVPSKPVVWDAPIRAYAALAAGRALQPWTFEPGPLASDEVELAITHCGFCHGDLHLIDNDLGISAYPLVPGHEVVGTITAIGERAEGLAIGQRVGVGWQRGACNRCEWCLRGLQNRFLSSICG